MVGEPFAIQQGLPESAEHSFADTNSPTASIPWRSSFVFREFFMLDNKFQLPVKRIGNEVNPKLVILLCNPGGNPDLYKRLPEYAMKVDSVYKDTQMSLNVIKQYSDWFDDILNVISQHGLKPDELLFLEYYPYHTVASGGFNHNQNKWDDDAKTALRENIEILKKHMSSGVPIFGYYCGDWKRVVPELKKYEPKHLSTKGWKKTKIKELNNFLSKGI